ncbi:MAG: hypothetical protein U0163_19230 [Gemmatimonadaceae bacterium]
MTWQSSTPEELVHGLLGEYADATATRELTASLPLSVRHPLLRHARAGVLTDRGLHGTRRIQGDQPATVLNPPRRMIWGLPDSVAGRLLVFPSPVVDEVNVFGGRVAADGDSVVARSSDSRFP